MPNVPPFAVRPPIDGTRSWVALGVSAAVHAIIVAWAVLQPPSDTQVVSVARPPDGQQVAIAPVEMPALSQREPEPEPAPRQPAPPQDAQPLGPDSDNPDVRVPREAGPVEPEPEINPPAAPGESAAEADVAPPESAPARPAPRIPPPSEYAFSMSRFRPPTSAFGGPPIDVTMPRTSAPPERPVSMGAGGRVGMSSTPDSRDWRPSFPDAAGKCVEIPDLGRNPDGSPVLASVMGRVYEADGRTPLIGAHLQIVGTRFVTFSSASGDYRLEFDPKLLERCRVQYVRVAADGYDGRMLTLSIGRQIRSDDVLLRRR